jgi:hypothetical protein
MANPTNLTAASSTTDATSYNTVSISPTTGRTVHVFVQNRQASGTPATPTISGYTQVRTINPAVATVRRMTWLKAPAGAAGALTIDFGGTTQTSCSWSIFETDEDTVVQSADNSSASATSLTVTLSAFASSSNLAVGSFVMIAQQDMLPGSGFTELGQTDYGENVTTHSAEWKANDPTVDMSYAGAATIWYGIAGEIAMVSGGGGIVRQMLAHEHMAARSFRRDQAQTRRNFVAMVGRQMRKAA